MHVHVHVNIVRACSKVLRRFGVRHLYSLTYYSGTSPLVSRVTCTGRPLLVMPVLQITCKGCSGAEVRRRGGAAVQRCKGVDVQRCRRRRCSSWRVLRTSAQRHASAECVSLTGQISETRWNESFFVLAAHTEVGMGRQGWE